MVKFAKPFVPLGASERDGNENHVSVEKLFSGATVHESQRHCLNVAAVIAQEDAECVVGLHGGAARDRRRHRHPRSGRLR